MSVYYFMACNDCAEILDDVIAVTRNHGQHLDSQDSLLKFLLQHSFHNLSFLPEFYSDVDEAKYEKYKRVKIESEEG